jgi:hypothetical protein
MVGKAEPDINNITRFSPINIRETLDINFPPKILKDFTNLLRRKTPKRLYKKI